MLKELGKFALEVLKELDWKAVLWKAYETVVRAKLKAYVTDSESKWDDVMYKGVDKLVTTYFKPEAPSA